MFTLVVAYLADSPCRYAPFVFLSFQVNVFPSILSIFFIRIFSLLFDLVSHTYRCACDSARTKEDGGMCEVAGEFLEGDGTGRVSGGGSGLALEGWTRRTASGAKEGTQGESEMLIRDRKTV